MIALSPRLNLNKHPRNAIRWSGPHGGKPRSFYARHKLGASKMTWQFTFPYVREVDSLFHYPEVSQVSGKPIDWYSGEPDDGYEGARIYGPHTLEIKGMPMGRTPEYMQERLRRFFSKFGPVQHCRAEPHPFDPYQCEGKAYVSFRDKKTALKALRAPLKFPASLHDKVVSMRHLDTDKHNDPDYLEKSKFWNRELISIARQLHMQLIESPTFQMEGKPLRSVGTGILENEKIITDEVVPAVRGRAGIPARRGDFISSLPTRSVVAGPAVLRRYGAWEAFLTEPPMDELFEICRAGGEEPHVGATDSATGSHAPSEGGGTLVVRPRLVSKTQRSRILYKVRTILAKRLHEEFSVYWRQHKIPLPDYTQRRVDWWDHKPPLHPELQMMSRKATIYRVFDEKMLYLLQLRKVRNAKRAVARAAAGEQRQQKKEEQQQAWIERNKKAYAAVADAKCNGHLGRSTGLIGSGWLPNMAGGNRSPPESRVRRLRSHA